MNVSQLKESKFLTKSDVGKGTLVTIKGDAYQENVSKEGAPVDLKWCIEFNELEKPLIVNSTNGQLIAQITGSEESSTWDGHKIVLYEDPSVSFGGKLVGGIRVRAPRGPKLIVPGNPAWDANPAKPFPQPQESAAQAQQRIADQQRYNEIAAATLARAKQPTSGINNPALRNPPTQPPEPPQEEESDVPF